MALRSIAPHSFGRGGSVQPEATRALVGRARAVWWLPVPRELRRVLASVLLWRAARPLLVDPAAGVSASRQGRVRVYAVECSSELAAVRSAAAQRALATPADQPSRCGCTRGGID